MARYKGARASLPHLKGAGIHQISPHRHITISRGRNHPHDPRRALRENQNIEWILDHGVHHELPHASFRQPDQAQ